MSPNDTVVLHEMIGDLYSSVKTGKVIERHGDRLVVEDRATKQLRECIQRNILQKEHIACGDEVYYQLVKPSSASGALYQHEGIAVGRGIRNNLLCRKPDFQQKGTEKLKVIAANVDQLFVVVSPVPHVSLESIDQLLVAGEVYGMRSILVLNKADMKEMDQLKIEMNFYSRLADGRYPMLLVSSHTGEGLQNLRQELRGVDGGTSGSVSSLFIGQSGVGKSSLINKLLGVHGLASAENPLEIGELTKKGSFGSHCTTNARLLHIPNNENTSLEDEASDRETIVIDTPGIRELHIANLKPQLVHKGFPDITSVARNCQYRNCEHKEGQEGCAVRLGLSDGSIIPSRLRSYFSFMAKCEMMSV